MAGDQQLGLGSGLVEIAALTALIGATTAESLVLGSRGACGLPWAGLTSFGSIFVVKACISACTPPWLRDTVGVRSKSADAAVGLSESLQRKTKSHASGEAIGVAVTINKVGLIRMRSHQKLRVCIASNSKMYMHLTNLLIVFYTPNLRLLALATAVSRYQVLNHPRGSYAYTEDAQDPAIIRDLLTQANFEFLQAYDISGQHSVGGTIEITVSAVIGDTLLSSLAWIMGSPLTGMDVYDCCILAFQKPSSLGLIPAARVLTSRTRPEMQKDPESSSSPVFLPKGLSNVGADLSWVYWIPCTEDRWLTFSTPWTKEGGSVTPSTGNIKMCVTTGSEITAVLESKALLVSLTSVDDVEDTVKKSNVVGRILRDVVRDPKALYSIKSA